jgi:hypothetical protein
METAVTDVVRPSVPVDPSPYAIEIPAPVASGAYVNVIVVPTKALGGFAVSVGGCGVGDAVGVGVGVAAERRVCASVVTPNLAIAHANATAKSAKRATRFTA